MYLNILCLKNMALFEINLTSDSFSKVRNETFFLLKEEYGEIFINLSFIMCVYVPYIM